MSRTVTADPVGRGAPRILAGALRVIGRAGIDGVTHRRVAAEVGISVGAVAHHFSARDALVEAALRFAVGRELERVRGFALQLQDIAFDRTRWVDAVAGWYARELARDADTHIACYEAFLAAARDARYRAIVREWFATYERSAELAMRAAGSRDPAHHAQVVVAAMMGLVLQQLAIPRRGFRRAVREQLGALIDALVSARGSAGAASVPEQRRRRGAVPRSRA